MRRRQAALAKARRKLEVDRHAVVRALQAAAQALRVAGARTRQAVAVLEQLARHVDLGAVDREQPPTAPALDLLVAQALDDPAVAFGERLRADFHPRRAHRRGRHRMLLRQRHAEQAALVPQLVERDLIALAVVREHQPEHEQHHQQRADRAPPHPPAGIAGLGRLGHDADKVAPQRDEPPVGRRLRERRGLFLARAPLVAQDRSRIGLQRLQIHVLGRLALAAVARAAAGMLPARGAVARALADPPVHERLDQRRAHLPARLPVVRQPRRRQRQRMARQILRPHPRQDQEPRVADHPLQPPVEPPAVPADPLVAAPKPVRGALEQQASQPPAIAGDDEVSQMAAHRPACPSSW